MSLLKDLKKDLSKLRNPEKAAFLQRFFKTDEGQYGYGDIFLGITVPEQRIVAKKYSGLLLPEIDELLKSKIHEERLTGIIILVDIFLKADQKTKKDIYDFYISHAKQINNWDLVDASAAKIVGEYLLDKDRSVLVKLANSKNIWEKRISIISTFAFLKNKENEWTFKIAEILLTDPHDLIQKAVGWMLRESGKKVSEKDLLDFLNKHYKQMPRTMLRYSIEKLPEKSRIDYLKGNI